VRKNYVRREKRMGRALPARVSSKFATVYSPLRERNTGCGKLNGEGDLNIGLGLETRMMTSDIRGEASCGTLIGIMLRLFP